MNGFSSLLNDVEVSRIFPNLLSLCFFCFPHSKLPTREKGRQTVLPLCTRTFQTHKAAVLECALAYKQALKLWPWPLLKKIKLMQSVEHAAFN